MKSIILIFIGGGLGSVFRFIISNYLNNSLLMKCFPIGTFGVNFLGSFLLGILYIHFMKDDFIKPLLMIGFCGGFTTFSTFTLDNWTLFQKEEFLLFFVNIFLSVFLSFSGLILGMKIIK